MGGHSDSSCRHCVAVWVEMGSLRMPRLPAVPLLLIGPGTGVAPFRAFLEERQAMSEVQAEAAAAKLHWPQLGPCSDADNKEGPLEAVDPAMSSSAVAVPQQLDGPAVPPLPPLPPPLAACCLFVGCRSAQADCYYLEQWQALQAAGVLVRQAHGLSIAASRDQPQKVGDDDIPALDGGELVRWHHSTGVHCPCVISGALLNWSWPNLYLHGHLDGCGLTWKGASCSNAVSLTTSPLMYYVTLRGHVARLLFHSRCT